MTIAIGAAFLAVTLTTLAAADVPGYDPHDSFTATYTLPTPTKELAAFATWNLKSVKWVQNKDTVQATYIMPEELIEEAGQKVTMTGKIRKGQPFFPMQGTNVQAQCTESPRGTFLCLVHFEKEGMPFKTDTTFIKSHYKNAEAAKRIRVAALFQGDPIGLIRIEKSP
jgi:hypothetical protein